MMKADDFNEWYKVGHPVYLVDDFGKEHFTHTRSEAWTLCSGEAVVLVEGRTGGYSLDRIRPLECYTEEELKL